MKVLFMCTHNSCRSILSEALFNHLAPEGLEAVSSGSFPSGRVNQRALQTLEAVGISTVGLSSKASDAFEGSLQISLLPFVIGLRVKRAQYFSGQP